MSKLTPREITTMRDEAHRAIESGLETWPRKALQLIEHVAEIEAEKAKLAQLELFGAANKGRAQ